MNKELGGKRSVGKFDPYCEEHFHRGTSQINTDDLELYRKASEGTGVQVALVAKEGHTFYTSADRNSESYAVVVGQGCVAVELGTGDPACFTEFYKRLNKLREQATLPIDVEN